MRAFLWKGQTEGKGAHKEQEAMWIKWINTYRLKDKSIWDIQLRSVDTWTWTEMLKFREILKPHVKWSVGNGVNVNFLHDNWYCMGVLHEIFRRKEVSLLRIEHEDSLAYALRKFHSPRDKHDTDAMNRCRNDMPILSDRADVVCWNGA
ncbi:hypothetical protein LIER_06333 [Lithospermum erythrorhizon]|uniref:Uncharacterized protein n=1 Tax=Lithospermum erythrorhizon TaxID=34254 RepID=A0AAV3P3X1_LITER